MTIDQLYSQVSVLSVADQLRLVERVVHAIAVKGAEPRPTQEVIGLFAEDADLLDRVTSEAMAARSTRPLRIENA